MKISKSLVLGFGGIVLLITAAEHLFIYESTQALQREISRHTVERAMGVISEIDRDIYHRLEQVQAYSKDLANESILTKSNLDFDRLNNAEEVIKELDEEWKNTEKETITPFMQEIIDNEVSDKIREEFELKDFYIAKYGYPVFAEVLVTNKYGANVAQSQKTTDYYQADEEWWQVTKQNGYYVSNINYDKSASIYSLDICSRIDDANGDFLGVLKAVFNTAEIVHILEESKKVSTHSSTQFDLLTSDGEIIYSTEDYSFMTDLFDKTPPFHKEPAHNYFISRSIEDGGVKKLFAYSHSQGYKDFRGLKWTLVVEHETRDIFAPITILKRRLLYTSLGLLLLIISFGLFITKKISEPLKSP